MATTESRFYDFATSHAAAIGSHSAYSVERTVTGPPVRNEHIGAALVDAADERLMFRVRDSCIPYRVVLWGKLMDTNATATLTLSVLATDPTGTIVTFLPDLVVADAGAEFYRSAEAEPIFDELNNGKGEDWTFKVLTGTGAATDGTVGELALWVHFTTNVRDIPLA